VTARVGQGFDAHRLVAGRALRLGGVEIAHERGLAGHSDGDVLLHAITRALLGALGAGDLGEHYPSADARWQGADSAVFVRDAAARARAAGLAVGNLDATLIAEAPRLAPYREAMRRNVAELLGAPLAAVNLQVTSTDGLGAIGRGEGIAAQAVVLLCEDGAGA
jgi:2-C-methyl-D-erythritol 4-phosphate cytidylyltransferase / 2-C-methyl-D-erythritol 2,4-cyclodiphosphate synthase